MDAIQFLKRRMKVWCKSRVRWERDNLYLLPSGDFTDDEGRLHRREHHTAYVTLEDAILAIRMVEEKFLADKETELQRLESENYTFINKHPCVIPVFGRTFPDPNLYSLHSGTVQMAEMVLKSEYFTITKTRLQ